MNNSKYLCHWSFGRGSEFLTKEYFNRLDNNSRDELLAEKLSYLKSVLNVFHREQLFIANRMEVTLSGGEIHQDDGYAGNLDVIMADLKNMFDEHSQEDVPFVDISFSGRTQIATGGYDLSLKGLIEVSYDFRGDKLEVHTTSDLWSPISLDEVYQIDIALLNNPRLEKCLNEVEALWDYASIFPGKEEIGDGELSQLGFRVLVSVPDVLERTDFPKGREADVKPYMWQFLPPYSNTL